MIRLKPDHGYYLHSVICDDEDVTEKVNDGVVKLAPPEHEMSISVIFAANESIPNTGDDSRLFFFGVTAVASLFGIAVLLTVNKKGFSKQ